jgi:signal transduction histidine kinase
MKIRDKLFLGFSLYMLLAIIMAFFSYKELRSINTRLISVEVVDDIANSILEIRRHEKNYLLFKNEESLKEIRSYHIDLNKNIDNIKSEIITEIGTATYTMLKNTMSNYELLIDNLSKTFQSEEKLAVLTGTTGTRIEHRLSGRELSDFLTLRRHEKNILLYKDQLNYEIFESFSPLNLRNDKEVSEYRTIVRKLFMSYKDEKDLTDNIRLKGRELQSITKNLSKKEREYIDVTLKKAGKFLFYGLITIILLGIIINIKLSRNIAIPIKKLEEITKKISAGDYSDLMEVKGSDEIASLEISFNQMEKKLLETKFSLEHAIQKLHEKQSQLVAAEKLATLGTFAAGVAHEINNPLAIINEKAGLMKDILEMAEDFKYKSKFLDQVDAITESVKRCRNITHRILGFARKTEVSIEVFDINDIINELKGFLEKEVQLKNIQLEMNLSENLPKVRSDRGQLQQIFLNIAKNAIDAVDNGGVVAIFTGTKDPSTVRVAMQDNGHGISDDALKHIFEPFFTTKEKGKGTGLGLSITYGIIKNLGGDIHVESEVNKGTTFVIELPINPEHTKGEIA